jgi:histidine triad (HIT) family protein
VAEECLFCRIVRGEIPSEEVYRTESVYAFRDITPVAPAHVLVVPVAHVGSLSDLADRALGADLLLACAEVAARTGVEQSGYRVVANTGRDAGQSVAHLHLHVLGGRTLEWPPG